MPASRTAKGIAAFIADGARTPEKFMAALEQMMRFYNMGISGNAHFTRSVWERGERLRFIVVTIDTRGPVVEYITAGPENLTEKDLFPCLVSAFAPSKGGAG